MMIFILEDDTALCSGIELALAAPGRQFTSCHDIASAKAAVQINTPDFYSRKILERFMIYTIGSQITDFLYFLCRSDYQSLVGETVR